MSEVVTDSGEAKRRTGRILHSARKLLTKRLLRLLGFALFIYIFLQVVPGLEEALKNLENMSLSWIVWALVIETVSEIGYVISWRGVVDPDNLLYQADRGKHLGARVAWAQLGGGMVVPGGTLGSIGVGAWILNRLGMPMEKVAERQFVLMFLNSSVDGLAIIFFGLGLGVGLFSGIEDRALMVIPAVVVAIGFALALWVAKRADRLAARWEKGRPRVAKAIDTLAKAVEGVKNILRHRGSGRVVMGAIIYLGFDMLVLWSACKAIGADPAPTFAIVAMSYLIGGLAGSIPLPAAMGAITGMAGMLIVFGVDKNDAIAAVVAYQAIGFIVPLVGGGISYLFLRRTFGQMEDDDPQPAGSP